MTDRLSAIIANSDDWFFAYPKRRKCTGKCILAEKSLLQTLLESLPLPGRGNTKFVSWLSYRIFETSVSSRYGSVQKPVRPYHEVICRVSILAVPGPARVIPG